MKSKASGFTLIEVIISVSIVAILASMAVPNLQKFLSSNRLNAASRGLQMDLLYARSEAIKRGFSVSVCVSNANQTGCDSSVDDYAKGWIIFTDYNANGDFNPAVTADTTGDGIQDSREEILQVSHGISEGLVIDNAGALEDSITYRSTGQVATALVSPNDRLYINRAGSAYQNITISVTGRVKTCSVTSPAPNGMC